MSEVKSEMGSGFKKIIGLLIYNEMEFNVRYSNATHRWFCESLIENEDPIPCWKVMSTPYVEDDCHVMWENKGGNRRSSRAIKMGFETMIETFKNSEKTFK